MINTKVTKWLPPFTVMLIIFLFSATPGSLINEIGLGHESLHISGHSIMFFILCMSFFKSTKDAYLSVIFASIYGVLDEFHQMGTFMRSSSFLDIYTDVTAAILAGVILWKLQYILPNKLKNWLNN